MKDKRILRQVGAILMTMVLSAILMIGCTKTSKTLSGSYDIEEFCKLIEKATDAIDSASKYATEEEATEEIQKKYQQALREIGFHGQEEIIVNGRVGMYHQYYDEEGEPVGCFINIQDVEGKQNIYVTGAPEKIGWAQLLEEDSNVKVKFYVLPRQTDDGEVLEFSEGEILSPSKPEFESNCHVETGNQIVMGTVEAVYDNFALSEEEIEEKMDEAKFGDLYWWYSAMRFSDMYVVLEDNEGHEIGVFLSKDNCDPTLDTGDRIACKGEVYEDISIEDLPTKFMKPSNGSCFVFDN